QLVGRVFGALGADRRGDDRRLLDRAAATAGRGGPLSHQWSLPASELGGRGSVGARRAAECAGFSQERPRDWGAREFFRSAVCLCVVCRLLARRSDLSRGDSDPREQPQRDRARRKRRTVAVKHLITARVITARGNSMRASTLLLALAGCVASAP